MCVTWRAFKQFCSFFTAGAANPSHNYDDDDDDDDDSDDDDLSFSFE